MPHQINRLMASCTHHVSHVMAHNAQLAVMLVISLNQQLSRVEKMDFGSLTMYHVMVSIQRVPLPEISDTMAIACLVICII